MASSLGAPVSSGLVQPLGPFGCFTRVHIHSVLALLAAHSAAPVELALALGDAGDARGVVAAPAAHHLAAVGPARRLAAHAAGRAQGACQGYSTSGCASGSAPPCPPTRRATGGTGISVCTGDLGDASVGNPLGNPLGPVTVLFLSQWGPQSLQSLRLLCFMDMGCHKPGQRCSFGVSHVPHDGGLE